MSVQWLSCKGLQVIEIIVDLGDRSYPVKIAAGCLKLETISRFIGGSQALVVTNETVAPIYLSSLIEKLESESRVVDSLILPDGEKYKSLATLNKIFDCLIENRHDRTTTLIALGGGVVGDMTGFAAACYQRGVSFVQIPTTLLAQVDSSVGGKTAVNHPSGKNMIGAFYQPEAVFIDTDTLETLPDRDYAAGLAEVIKYGLIADRGFFAWLEENIGLLIERDPEIIGQAIAVSCQTKAEIVAADETEQGIRAILNLGHTFGHAIETAQEYKEWLHGEAVGAGMVMAADLSCRQGLISEEDLHRIQALISRAGLPVRPPGNIGKEQFLSLMSLDKKVLEGRLRLVLLRNIGDAFVTSDLSMQSLGLIVSP